MFKFLPHKTDGWLAGWEDEQTYMTHNIDPYVTHMDQKAETNVEFKLFQHHLKFVPVQKGNVWENEGSRFCFVPTLWPPARVNVTVIGFIYQNSTVPNSMVGTKKLFKPFVHNEGSGPERYILSILHSRGIPILVRNLW